MFCVCLIPQNIIKKVNGQKFVYRFVSYPDIQKGEFTGRTDTNELASDSSPEPQSNKASAGNKTMKDSCTKQNASAPGQPRSSSRNDYLHSGLYTSFTLTSLQSGTQLFKSIRVENPAEKKEAAAQPASVIKFGTQGKALTRDATDDRTAPRPVQVQILVPENVQSGLPEVTEMAPTGLSGISSSPSPPPGVSADSKELVIDTDIESVSSQHTELQVSDQGFFCFQGCRDTFTLYSRCDTIHDPG